VIKAEIEHKFLYTANWWSQPPESVKAKGRKGDQYGRIVAMQGNPNTFQVRKYFALSPGAAVLCFRS